MGDKQSVGLKPCPFCNHKDAEIVKGDTVEGHAGIAIHCFGCGARMTTCLIGESKAMGMLVHKWNTRATPGAIKALEGVKDEVEQLDDQESAEKECCEEAITAEMGKVIEILNAAIEKEKASSDSKNSRT